MLEHHWQLRHDPAPFEAAADAWDVTRAHITRAADRVVAAARQALDTGWESASAEAYEHHRRQVVQGLDQLVRVAGEVSGCLRALATLLEGAQQELDTSWARVRSVRHELVGEDRRLVWSATSDEEEALVRGATRQAEDVRARLDLALAAEARRLDGARADFDVVRLALTQVAGRRLDGLEGSTATVTGTGPGADDPHRPTVAGVLATPLGQPAGGSVGGGEGPTGAGVAAAAPDLGPVPVSAPDLSGLSLSGLTPAAVAGAAGVTAAALAGRRRQKRPQESAGMLPPMGGMAAGVGARGTIGATARGVGGPAVLKPAAPSEVDERQRAARAKEEAREAKRAAIAERQAARAARRAAREGAAGTGADDSTPDSRR